jgi:omega-hydroxy-beta-dihydromenaquinone-9 sulfotransferase
VQSARTEPRIMRPIIVLVGTSRSGKTVVANALSRSPEVFRFRELHFFGSSDCVELDDPLTHEAGVQMYANLLDTQENGILGRGNNSEFLKQARQQVSDGGLGGKSAVEIYKTFLSDYAEHQKPGARPCEQTGAYVYFIGEMISLIPDIRIVCMVRDPRFVLASKKEKWSWKQAQKNRAPVREWIRQKLQYHPWILTRLWITTACSMSNFKEYPEVRIQKFETFKQNTEEQVSELCHFLGIEYQTEMRAGFRKIETGVDSISQRTPASRRDTKRLCASMGISPTELFIVQVFSASEMQLFGYEHWKVWPNPVALLWYLFVLPLKLVLATLINLNRIGRVIDAVKHRVLLTPRS